MCGPIQVQLHHARGGPRGARAARIAPHFAVPHAGTPASRMQPRALLRRMLVRNVPVPPRCCTPCRFAAIHRAPHRSSTAGTAHHCRRAVQSARPGRARTRHNVGLPLSNSARTVGRVHTQALAPSTAQQVRGDPRTEPGRGSRQHCPRQPCDPSACETFGQAPAAANHDPAQSGRGKCRGTNHAPILRNATFASLSPRNAESHTLIASASVAGSRTLTFTMFAAPHSSWLMNASD